MDKQEVEKIVKEVIRQQFDEMVSVENFLFKKNAKFVDDINIEAGYRTGMKIGTATTQKLGFFNTTPVDQPATVGDASGGTTIDSEARTAINNLIDRLQELGLIST